MNYTMICMADSDGDYVDIIPSNLLTSGKVSVKIFAMLHDSISPFEFIITSGQRRIAIVSLDRDAEECTIAFKRLNEELVSVRADWKKLSNTKVWITVAEASDDRTQ